MNDTLITPFLKPVETALNAYLTIDENSKRRLAKAAGKSLQVELKPFGLFFTCIVNATNIELTGLATDEATAKVKGTPLQLAGVAISRNNRQQFFADDLSIEGDAEFAQQLIDLFDSVEIDWEEHLAALIGDVPAYQVSKYKNKFKKWLRGSKSSLVQDISDFLHEEAAWFPVREELNEFFEDIDSLRMDTDRLESRISLLHSQTNKEEQK